MFCWKEKSQTMADINNDGKPDAYWDTNLTLRAHG